MTSLQTSSIRRDEKLTFLPINNVRFLSKIRLPLSGSNKPSFQKVDCLQPGGYEDLVSPDVSCRRCRIMTIGI